VTGIHHTAIVTADLERSTRFWRDGLGFAELFDHTFNGDWPTLFGATTDRLRSVFLGDPHAPDTGIVELAQFEDGVRRIEMPAPGGKTVLMAVITAPDGVRVELIGPPE
jgi:glyoxylase I family protein